MAAHVLCDIAVERFEVEVEPAQISRFELAYLQFDDDEAIEAAGEE